MRLPLIYVAHPYGGNPSNLDRADLWLERLTRWSGEKALYWAPWIQLCRMCPDVGETRERGLEIDQACVEMSDGMLMVGGCVSPGMSSERIVARSVLDLSALTGPEQLLQSLSPCGDLLAWVDVLTKGSNR